ncbi:MAG: viroplasmin family protein, partial [Clostridium perfringens]
MAKKIYAVRKGINPGIYFTWDECKSNVNGYPGAEYKSFQSEHEAKEYLGIIEKKDIEDKTKECNAKVIAYVDG